MRTRDYLHLSWDQLKRRKVVTGLCAAGISIGCAAIIIAMSVGESAQDYAEKELNSYLKMDEITVTPNTGVNQGGGQNKGNDQQANRSNDDGAQKQGKITDQKIEVMRNIPHVTAVAPYQQLGYLAMYTMDNRRNGGIEVLATDLNTLSQFVNPFMQGAPSDLEGTVVLNYGATYGVIDQETMDKLVEQLNNNPYDDSLTEQYRNLNRIPTVMYQKQICLKTMDYMSSPLRVSGVLKKPAGVGEMQLFYDKKLYVSLETGKMLMQELRLNNGNEEQGTQGTYNNVIVKVDDQANVEQVEKLIKKLTLNTSTNLHQKDKLQENFAIVKTIALGIGLFVLFIASISIVVAMTMSTYQRRRQIGIMKVLGANLRQIRNMFIIEAALLGWVGGLIGVMLSYWIVWGINGMTASVASEGTGDSIIFISYTNLPIGIAFAIFTGILSGIYPAISASRTDALTAIKRD